MAVKLFYLAKNCCFCPPLRRFLEWMLRYICGIEISGKMQCGVGLKLPHNGLGVVIHQNTIIGNNVKVLQNVTIGGRNGSGLPIIGDNVVIGAGAVLLGDIKIGNNVRIGANAVVLCDVPEDAIAVGVPAVIKQKKR
ncbi:serine O-acetyltransferase [Holdemania massiliensis]|uniref:serine O-acetyltransferase n=1 Tax=Holdemania massiliensis TaxID=1468449 RepID=UPI0035230AAA